MAGHIQDRWFRTETSANGKPHRVKTNRHGTGMRYRARYIGPDGTEKSKSFPDGQKRLAEKWLAQIEADMSRGTYISPKADRVTFQQFVEQWLATKGGDPNTQASMGSQFRLHVFPHIGTRPLPSFQPTHIRQLLTTLTEAGIRGSYARVIYSGVRAALSAAVDDGYLPRNPCSVRSVKAPSVEPKRVIPWLPEHVFAVREALPERYRTTVDIGAGCGLRQGEILGLAVESLDFGSNTLHVVQQLKYSRCMPVFAPPKGGKLRDIPLPGPVADALRRHMKDFPPPEITLPWGTHDGPLVTKHLIFSSKAAQIVRRSDFNVWYWKPALAAAGVIPEPGEGEGYAAAREHGMHALRHFYASVLLDGGESIKALSEYLGHHDAGFTLRTYTHLMPSSQERTRNAVSDVFKAAKRKP
jgi:integrase